jgi:hypothetical protein
VYQLFVAADGRPEDYTDFQLFMYDMGRNDARGSRNPFKAFAIGMCYVFGKYYVRGLRDGIAPVLATKPRLYDDPNIKLLKELEIIQ